MQITQFAIQKQTPSELVITSQSDKSHWIEKLIAGFLLTLTLFIFGSGLRQLMGELQPLVGASWHAIFTTHFDLVRNHTLVSLLFGTMFLIGVGISLILLNDRPRQYLFHNRPKQLQTPSGTTPLDDITAIVAMPLPYRGTVVYALALIMKRSPYIPLGFTNDHDNMLTICSSLANHLNIAFETPKAT